MHVEVDREVPWAVSWTVTDEVMERSSHALAHDGRVWFVDPVDDDEAVAAALSLGEPAGVLQLLDRHPRACEELAGRFGVPLHRLPENGVPEAPFELRRTVWRPGWRELHLRWAEHGALLVSEAVGTASYFAAGRRLGVHPFLRVTPPGSLRGAAPEHLLCGHGPPLHADAAAALGEALDRSRTDIPRAALASVRAWRPGR